MTQTTGTRLSSEQADAIRPFQKVNFPEAELTELQGGFEIDKMEAGYIARFPKSWTYFCWGTAIPQAR